MCWSFKASIITWILATITAVYLLTRQEKNDIVMGCLILVYSSMQLWESLIWYDQKCGTVNLIGTRMAYIALWSHILAIGIGLYIEYNVMWPIVLGIMFLVLAFILQPTSWDCSKPGKNKNLVWGFDPSFYSLVFSFAIILCMYYIRPLPTAAIISSLFLTSFLFSILYDNNSGSVGSFWCWLCALFSFVFVFKLEKTFRVNL